MLKNDNHYYIVCQNTSENNYLFEVKNHPLHLCNKPTEVYPTTYDSMYVAIHYGGFDMKTGRMIKLHPVLYDHHPYNLTRVVVSSSTFPMKKCSRHRRI